MAEYGEWNRKGATLSDVTARKKYGVSRDFIVKGNRAGQPSLTRLACIPVLFSLLQLQVFAQYQARRSWG